MLPVVLLQVRLQFRLRALKLEFVHQIVQLPHPRFFQACIIGRYVGQNAPQQWFLRSYSALQLLQFRNVPMFDVWTRLALPFARISASFSAINAAPFLYHWNSVSKLLIFRKAIIQKRLPGHFA
jgi:hypothetical protein